MAVYTDTNLKEQAIYGSSRLGLYNHNPQKDENENELDNSNKHQLGQRYYELSNHLGNVLTVITDNKLLKADNFYHAFVLSATDYYPFGMAMEGRSFQSDAYRYGFNGKENDTDWGGDLIQDYGFRIYMPVIAKFLSVDPLTASYPWYTPYQFAGNKPINSIDLDGLEEFPTYIANGKSFGENLIQAGEEVSKLEFGHMGLSYDFIEYDNSFLWETYSFETIIDGEKKQETRIRLRKFNTYHRWPNQPTPSFALTTFISNYSVNKQRTIRSNPFNTRQLLPDGNCIDCAMGAQLTFLYAGLLTYGSDKFDNAFFNNDIGFYEFELNPFASDGIISTQYTETNYQVNGSLSHGEKVFENELSLLGFVAVGTRIGFMISNEPPDTLDPSAYNENFLKVDENLYFNHNPGAKSFFTATELLEKLNSTGANYQILETETYKLDEKISQD